MTNACKILTVAVMLLHSIFGCSLHHACACESHEHGEHQHVAVAEDANACDHDHASHHHDHGCHDDHQHADDGQEVAESLVRTGCYCCEKTPCEHGDSPCCTAVQCSYIPASDVEFSLDLGPVLFVLADINSPFMESLRARNLVDVDRFRSGSDDSLSRCALHCSWQI